MSDAVPPPPPPNPGPAPEGPVPGGPPPPQDPTQQRAQQPAQHAQPHPSSPQDPAPTQAALQYAAQVQAAARGPVAPLPGLPFTSSYRTPRTGWWRGVVSIVLVIVAILTFSFILSFVAIAVDLALGNADTDALMEGQVSMSPTLLAATNVSLLASAAVAFLAHRFLIGLRWGHFHSVVGRFRWSWLALAAAVVVPVYLLFAASSFLDPTYQDLQIDGTVVAFIGIIILTTPLQAAAEEYMFRGVVQRSAGSWVRSPRWSFILGTAVSAPLFAVFHFAQDPWLIFYYLCFGVLLSILTQLTGGLEAAIAIHIANNLFLLLVGALAGQMTEGFDRSAGQGGPFMLVPLVILAVVVVVLWLLGRRRKVETTTAEAAAPAAPVSPAAPASPGEAGPSVHGQPAAHLGQPGAGSSQPHADPGQHPDQ